MSDGYGGDVTHIYMLAITQHLYFKGKGVDISVKSLLVLEHFVSVIVDCVPGVDRYDAADHTLRFL